MLASKLSKENLMESKLHAFTLEWYLSLLNIFLIYMLENRFSITVLIYVALKIIKSIWKKNSVIKKCRGGKIKHQEKLHFPTKKRGDIVQHF